MGDPPFLRLVRIADACPSPLATPFFTGKRSCAQSAPPPPPPPPPPPRPRPRPPRSIPFVFPSSSSSSIVPSSALRSSASSSSGDGAVPSKPPHRPGTKTKRKRTTAAPLQGTHVEPQPGACAVQPRSSPSREQELERRRLAKAEKLLAKFNEVLANRILRGKRISKPPKAFDPCANIHASQVIQDCSVLFSSIRRCIQHARFFSRLLPMHTHTCLTDRAMLLLFHPLCDVFCSFSSAVLLSSRWSSQ
jgi:hypothetical protein